MRITIIYDHSPQRILVRNSPGEESIIQYIIHRSSCRPADLPPGGFLLLLLVSGKENVIAPVGWYKREYHKDGVRIHAKDMRGTNRISGNDAPLDWRIYKLAYFFEKKCSYRLLFFLNRCKLSCIS